MTDHVILSLLKQAPLFQGLTPAHRSAVADLCVRRELAKREPLFQEGTPGRTAYVLASGSIQLVKTTEEGRDIVIKTVAPRDVFAEVVLFERDTYPVTAVALNPTVVYALDRQDLAALLDDRDFRNDFLHHLTERLRYLTERIVYLTACDVEQRLMRFLVEHYGPTDTYTLTISKKDLASAIGATPETLSRLLQRLKKDGRLAWEGKTLRILDRTLIADAD
jgi:CRP/FNR family transcriptional regulator